MKFCVSKKILSEAIGNIIKAVSTKSTLPALEGILLKTIDNRIELTAYDLELGMKTHVEADIIEEGKIVVSAKLFADIVRKVPHEMITVNVNDKNNLEIISGNSNFNIIGIDSEEFPELPSISQDNVIKISGELLKGMIRQTIFAVADNDIKPINQGSLFNFYNGIFDLISVDGFRLAIRREKVQFDTNTSFIVPGKTLHEVLKLAGEGDIEIFSGRRHIMFKIDDYTIVSGVLEGDFIDYKNALPKEINHVIEVNTRNFIDSTERVSLLIDEKLKSPIRCKFNNESIELTCTTAIGKAKDSCPCLKSGLSIEMGFNNKYLLDALKNTECDMIKIHITGPLSPMLITPMEGEDFMFLVLPVRLKS